GIQAWAIKPFQLQSAESWLQSETEFAQNKIRENIEPFGSVAGVVVASPQKINPNYFRHWVRDAALVMKVVVQLSRTTEARRDRQAWERLIRDYVRFSRQNQIAVTLEGLGEPIFEVNGQPFSGEWGRPQNDGPALRALALIDWAEILLAQGK